MAKNQTAPKEKILTPVPYAQAGNPIYGGKITISLCTGIDPWQKPIVPGLIFVSFAPNADESALSFCLKTKDAFKASESILSVATKSSKGAKEKKPSKKKADKKKSKKKK